MLSFPSLPAISNSKLVTFTVLILQFVYYGYAIKCFVCDSTDNASCADLKSNSSLVAEECTLENMKSIDSWLFELNALAFYKNDVYRNPLFNCQKVVAREPKLNRVVTARFCQLDTAESDACKFFQKKMKQEVERQNNGFSRGDLSGGRRNSYDNPSYGNSEDGTNSNDRLIHCSICSEDRCNGNAHLSASKWSVILLLSLILQQLSSC